MIEPRGSTRPEGVYAILSERLLRGDADQLLAASRAALAGGARLLQYRDKWNPPGQKLALGRALANLCHVHGGRLIVNDDPALALAIDADGVHLGADDMPVAEARALLGADRLIGATCGNSLERARAAVRAGADHVAFGRFHPSRSKPSAPPASLDTLRSARELGVPICAIGGIQPQHVAEVVTAGADLVAAIDGIFGAHDIETATRAYVAAWHAARVHRSASH